jgi:MFS transporter, OPA family, glycerol-3-phosphate transporter
MMSTNLTKRLLTILILCVGLSPSDGFAQSSTKVEVSTAVTTAVSGEFTPKTTTKTLDLVNAPPTPVPTAEAPAVKAPTKTSAIQAPKTSKKKKNFLEKLAPILILLVVVAIVLGRLPQVEGVNHSSAFRKRRVFNWLPLGLTYAFLYMGRYNIKVSQHAFGDKNLFGQDLDLGACADAASQLATELCTPLMSNPDFAFIFMVGTWIYGCSFIINGPLTDRLGGKFAILMGAGGAAIANLLMGLLTWYALEGGEDAQGIRSNFRYIMAALYGVNMYFQSFGAVAIVKCNAPWFHLRERGVFGAIFGILISLGIYFAFDVGKIIIDSMALEMVFLIPAMLLVVFWVINRLMVRNTPGEAGFEDFNLGDASSDAQRLPARQVFGMMLRNPVIVTIALIEFCSGFLRQAIMQWYRTFAKQTDALLHLKGDFVYENWGMLLCCAGIMGGVMAGVISDRVFQSRRGPVAGILYVGMLVGSVLLSFMYDTPVVGVLAIFMSMCVIGVHGMLSGTASMDFGGKQNVGTAVGIIDGFVYAGTGAMSFLYMFILPDDSNPLVSGNPENWISWPLSMIPISLIGFVLATRVWNAKPKSS